MIWTVSLIMAITRVSAIGPAVTLLQRGGLETDAVGTKNQGFKETRRTLFYHEHYYGYTSGYGHRRAFYDGHNPS